jgi:phage-related protein (TIGR01555 family)
MVRAAYQAVTEYPSGLAPGQPGVERADGWTNVTTGLGTSRDKTMGGFFAEACQLTDPQLRALFNFDDLASKVIDVYPKEEFRLGFGLTGLDPKTTEQVDRYLKKFELVENALNARIFGRLFGGAAIWPLVDDGKDPSEELDLEAIKSVLGMRVIERPWLVPFQFYPDGPKVGQTMVYRIQEPHAGGTATTIGFIHETRLVIFPGERTDSMTKIRLRGWDLSALQKPYEALRSSGETWKAIELLVTDANQGIYKVSQLFSKVAGDTSQTEPTEGNPTGGGSFLKRVQVMDRIKSVFRAIVLDKDEEDYERLESTFTGLADLSDRAWRRVASAADLPVPLLQGENPAGLNNSGSMQLQWFWAKTRQNQTQIDEPRLLKVIRICLSAQDAPTIDVDTKDTESDKDGAEVDVLDKIGICWLPLWAPTAAELADIQLKTAQACQIWIAAQAMLPEEAILSVPKEWYPAVERTMREQSLEEDLETILKQKQEATKAGLEAQTAGHKAATELAENPPDPGDDEEQPPVKGQPPKGKKEKDE